jgi:hypothetical protein
LVVFDKSLVNIKVQKNRSFKKNTKDIKIKFGEFAFITLNEIKIEPIHFRFLRRSLKRLLKRKRKKKGRKYRHLQKHKELKFSESPKKKNTARFDFFLDQMMFCLKNLKILEWVKVKVVFYVESFESKEVLF